MKKKLCLWLLSSLALGAGLAQTPVVPAAITEVRTVSLPKNTFDNGGFAVNEMEGSLWPYFIMVDGRLVMWRRESHANTIFDRDLNLLRAHNYERGFPGFSSSGDVLFFTDGNYCSRMYESYTLSFYNPERRLIAEVNLEPYSQAQTLIYQQAHPADTRQFRTGRWCSPGYFGMFGVLTDGNRTWGGIINSRGQVSFDRSVLESFRAYNFQSLNWTRYNPVLASQMTALLREYDGYICEGARYADERGAISAVSGDINGIGVHEAVKRLLQRHFDRLGYDVLIEGSVEPVANGFIIWDRYSGGLYLSLTHNRIFSLPLRQSAILLWDERETRLYYVQRATERAWEVRIINLDFLQPPATTVDGGPVPPPPPPFVIPPEAIDQTVTRYRLVNRLWWNHKGWRRRRYRSAIHGGGRGLQEIQIDDAHLPGALGGPLDIVQPCFALIPEQDGRLPQWQRKNAVMRQRQVKAATIAVPDDETVGDWLNRSFNKHVITKAVEMPLQEPLYGFMYTNAVDVSTNRTNRSPFVGIPCAFANVAIVFAQQSRHLAGQNRIVAGPVQALEIVSPEALQDAAVKAYLAATVDNPPPSTVAVCQHAKHTEVPWATPASSPKLPGISRMGLLIDKRLSLRIRFQVHLRYQSPFRIIETECVRLIHSRAIIAIGKK